MTKIRNSAEFIAIELLGLVVSCVIFAYGHVVYAFSLSLLVGVIAIFEVDRNAEESIIENKPLLVVEPDPKMYSSGYTSEEKKYFVTARSKHTYTAIFDHIPVQGKDVPEDYSIMEIRQI